MDPYDWEWDGIRVAAELPPGNAHWEAVMDELLSDIYAYLED
jgi:hypothetical protein